MNNIKILFVSNNEEQFESFQKVKEVKRLPYDMIYASNSEKAIEMLSKEIEIVIANYWLSDGTVLDLLPHLPNIIPCLVLAEQGSEEHILQAINQGAADFIIKDPDERYLVLLPVIVRKALRYRDVHETHADIVRMSEKRFEHLVQAIPDIVYKLDPKGYFTFVNDSVRALGYEPEELVGKHFTEILRDEEVDTVSRREVLKEYKGKVTGPERAPKLFDERRCGPRKTTSLEIQIKKKPDGTLPDSKEDMIGSIIAYGEVSATGQYKQEKERRYFIGTVGIIRDITNKKKSQEMLQKLYMAVDQSPISILIFDKEGTIEYANPFFIHSNGYTPGELIGANVDLLKSSAISETMYEEIRETLALGQSWIGEVAGKNSRGGDNWGYVHISPVLNAAQEITHCIAIAEDITDQTPSLSKD